MTVFFLAGTDTAVGKTFVGVGLVRAWLRAGARVGAIKLIETGCASALDAIPIGEDGARLAAALDHAFPDDLVAPSRYRLPAAPAVAAEVEGPVDLQRIDAAVTAMKARVDVLLLEGAGGLLVPIADGLDMVDLVARYGASLLLVARASLGTINHTRLTVEAARTRRLPIAAVILNSSHAQRGPEESATPRHLARLTGLPVLGPVPYTTAADATPLAYLDSAERAVRSAFDPARFLALSR